MMLRINLDACTGCVVCVEICPIGVQIYKDWLCLRLGPRQPTIGVCARTRGGKHEYLG
jgi:ferredoxin